MRRFLSLVVAVLSFPAMLAATCTVTKHDNKNSWVTGFEGGLGTINPSSTSVDLLTNNGSPTGLEVTAGDLVVINAWCWPGCNVMSLAMGSQTLANGQIQQTTVSEQRSTEVGQNRFYYILSAASTGTQDITFVRSGNAGDGLEHQVSAMSFSVSSGCVWLHDLDTNVASGSGNDANAPSITAPGDLLFNFTMFEGHSNTWGSPWVASTWPPDYFQGLTNSSAAVAYVLPAQNKGTVANNLTGIYGDGNWSAMLTSFTATTQGPPPPAPPPGLTAQVN